MTKPDCGTPLFATHTARALDAALLDELEVALALWPWERAEMRSMDIEGWRKRLTSALITERRRGLAGHWTYDLARHRTLKSLSERLDAIVADKGNAT